jgi:hypothetical protein
MFFTHMKCTPHTQPLTVFIIEEVKATMQMLHAELINFKFKKGIHKLPKNLPIK